MASLRTATFRKFTLLLQPVLQYPYLKTEAFQAFRELGNCFTVAFVIDKVLVRGGSKRNCLSSFAVGEKLTNYVKSDCRT